MPYSITTKDGITLQNIPDDVAPDAPELRARVETIRSGSQGLGPDVAANGRTRESLQAEVDAFNKPAGSGERFLRGAAAPLVGAGQLVSRGMAAVGSGIEQLTGDTAATDYLQGLPAENDQATRLFEQDRDRARGNMEGTDWAGVAGSIATLAPTALAGGVPATIAGVARAGAVAGGIGGALEPTEGGDGYGGRKAVQTGLGAGVGAVAGPIASKALQGLGAVGASVINQVRKLGPRPSPQQIRITLEQTLQSGGIDLSRLPAGFLDDVTSQVRQAAGGAVDDASLVNRAAFESIGAKGTRGQVTQDPAQYGKELYLREAPGGEELAAQYKTTLQSLNQSLGDVQSGAAPPLRNVEAGQQVQQVLREADDRGRELVGRLYDQVRANPDADRAIDYASVRQATMTELYDKSLLGALPGTLRRPLEEGFQGRGAAEVGRGPTIRTADDINKTISQLISTAEAKGDEAALTAIGIYKRNLDEAVADAAQGAARSHGSTVADDLFTARGAAQQRFEIHEAIPAIRGAVNGTVDPDVFMRRYVYGAGRDDFRELATFVRRASPQTWQQLRGQVLGDLQKAANPSGQPADFTAAGFNRALRSLDASGKMEILLTPGEISQLRNIGKVADLTIKGPPGVSRTGLSGAAKAAGQLARVVGSLPGLGRVAGVAQAMAQRGANVVQSNVALTPPPVSQAALQNLIPGYLSRSAGAVAGPAATIPLRNNGS